LTSISPVLAQSERSALCGKVVLIESVIEQYRDIGLGWTGQERCEEKIHERRYYKKVSFSLRYIADV
jgi:hypothetical protein